MQGLPQAYPNLHLLSNVSEVTLQEGDPHGEEAFAVTVSPATKRKCNRCWLSICEDRDEPLCRVSDVTNLTQHGKEKLLSRCFLLPSVETILQRCRGAVSTFTDQ